MWSAISDWLTQMLSSKATPQVDSTATNLAAGAGNGGWGAMGKDLSAGNYASAAGNAIQMGQQNAQKQQGMNQGQIPQLPSSVTPTQQQPPQMGAGQSPYLQKLMQQYMR